MGQSCSAKGSGQVFSTVSHDDRDKRTRASEVVWLPAWSNPNFEFRLGENWGAQAGESHPPVCVSCQPCSPAGFAGLTIKQVHVSSA